MPTPRCPGWARTIEVSACGLVVAMLLTSCDGGGVSSAGPDAATAPPDAGPPFSFFVASMQTMIDQSGNPQGFGGNLGGLVGADRICQNAATAVGAGGKTWRAFLSVHNGGTPIHAIDRVGNGPWYDRNGRLIAMNKTGLLSGGDPSGQRPDGDPQAIDNMCDEHGTPLTTFGDSHDILTGSNPQGRLLCTTPDCTCADWTNATTGVGDGGDRRNSLGLGHAWSAESGLSWIHVHQGHGCAPGINLIQNGAGTGNTVGQGGGWGGIYCFALTP